MSALLYAYQVFQMPEAAEAMQVILNSTPRLFRDNGMPYDLVNIDDPLKKDSISGAGYLETWLVPFYQAALLFPDNKYYPFFTDVVIPSAIPRMFPNNNYYADFWHWFVQF